MLVLFATMTGNAEDAADRIARQLRSAGHEVKIANIEGHAPSTLPGREEPVLFVVSTWGDGEPPDEAVDFWDDLQEMGEASLAGLSYSVYALGDSGYDDFCGFGRRLDEELEKKGGARLAGRAEADIDYEEPLDSWVREVRTALETAPAA